MCARLVIALGIIMGNFPAHSHSQLQTASLQSDKLALTQFFVFFLLSLRVRDDALYPLTV